MLWGFKRVCFNEVCVLKEVPIKGRCVEHYGTKQPQKCHHTHNIFYGVIGVKRNSILRYSIFVFVFLYFNAIRVVLLSIAGCTILGIVIGVSRLSRNRMLSGLAESYVEFFRNMPLVVQLFFLYTVVLGANLPPFKEIQDSSLFDWIFISNRGVVVPETEIVDMTLFLLGIGALLAARI